MDDISSLKVPLIEKNRFILLKIERNIFISLKIENYCYKVKVDLMDNLMASGPQPLSSTIPKQRENA